MDEPCSALDPVATAKIEELLFSLKQDLTVVIVTHNMQQAARVSDWTAFMYLGELWSSASRNSSLPRLPRSKQKTTSQDGLDDHDDTAAL